MARYFEEVGRLTLPTKEEERAHFRAYSELTEQIEAATDPAKVQQLTRKRAQIGHKIACGYVQFVIGKAAKRTKNPDLRADLISAGNEGLMVAISKFDLKFDVRFLTYADYWVRVKMDEVLHKLSTVHVSVHIRKQSVQRGEQVEDPAITPIDDVQVADSFDIEDEIRPRGRVAMEYLLRAGLSREERWLLSLFLGLRGDARSTEEIALIFYGIHNQALPPETLSTRVTSCLARVRAWLDAHPEIEARVELG